MMYVKQRTIKCRICGEFFSGKFNRNKRICNVCKYRRDYMHNRPDIVDIIKKILNYQEDYIDYHHRINDKTYNMLVKEADSRLK